MILKRIPAPLPHLSDSWIAFWPLPPTVMHYRFTVCLSGHWFPIMLAYCGLWVLAARVAAWSVTHIT